MRKKQIPLPKLSRVDLDVPHEKKNFNRELFREVAPRYGRITGALSLGRDRSWKRDLVDRLPDVAPKSLLVDLACGTGDLCERLGRRYPGAAVVGIDQNPEMLAIAKERLRHHPNITLLQGDIQSLPVESGSATLVTGGYAVRNAPHLRDTLREVHRVLAKEGIAAFLDFSKPPPGIAQRSELALLKLWGSLFGVLFHRNPEVYGYIAKSLSHFPDRLELTRLLDDAGLHTFDTRYPFMGFLELRWTRKR